MKFLACCLCLAFVLPVYSQTRTVKALYDEYRNNRSGFESKYRNQKITVTGKIRSISVASDIWKDQDVHRIHLTATGYENFVVCQIPYKDSALLKQFRVGDMITVTGVVGPNVTDALFLSQCTFGGAPAISKKPAAPVNAPLGKYEVYQNDGTGFNYQYTFNLKSYRQYVVNGRSGSCLYDPKTKVIRFQTGNLKGFTGLYLSTTSNEKDPPTILLDAKGNIPDPGSKHQGYQFGYFHK